MVSVCLCEYIYTHIYIYMDYKMNESTDRTKYQIQLYSSYYILNMSIWLFECPCVCVCVSIWVSMYVCVYPCMHLSWCICTFVCVSVCVHFPFIYIVCMNLLLHVCGMCAYFFVYAYWYTLAYGVYEFLQKCFFYHLQSNGQKNLPNSGKDNVIKWGQGLPGSKKQWRMGESFMEWRNCGK